MQPGKPTWKVLVKNHVTSTWEDDLKKLKSTKSSVQYINMEHICLKEPYMVWKVALGSTEAVNMAIIKARLLTGTYHLPEKRIACQ